MIVVNCETPEEVETFIDSLDCVFPINSEMVVLLNGEPSEAWDKFKKSNESFIKLIDQGVY